jgi:predicted AlkP superfamily phosphohydrolase/phosphomutase
VPFSRSAWTGLYNDRMNRLLLIGLDGADPVLMTHWMEEGYLPNLAGLAARGAFTPCRSTTPPATFPAWTTCVTGVNPGRHGIFDFTELAQGEYAIRFVNGSRRLVPAIWNVVSEAGGRVCVLGVPATWPPEAVNGIMVSGFDSPVCQRADRSFVYPTSAWPAVRGWPYADFQESRIGPGWHDMALRKLHEGIAAKERIACKLMAQEPWDFFMLVFGESDTVSHHFWLFHDPASPRHRPGYETAIRDIYRRLDDAVGTLMKAFGESHVLVVSDHGFGGAGTGVVHLNNWLATHGHLKFSEGGGDTLAKKIAMAAVPPAWRGALFRKLRPLANRVESSSRFGGIDWSGTSAWSEELNYFPSIRINLRGREPEGQVAPENYDTYCSELCNELKSWQWIDEAWRREELFSGASVERAPDIVLKLADDDGYAVNCLRARGGPAFRRLASDEYIGGKERGMNGVHRPDGVLLLSKPLLQPVTRLLDMAPTALALMGLAAPAMEGTVLAGKQREGTTSTFHPADTPYTTEDAEAIEARLRALGYFE